MIVVDASLALTWFMEERQTAMTEAALDYVTENDMMVPRNFIPEFINGLMKGERQKRISALVVTRAIIDIQSFEPHYEDADPHEIAAAARDFALTASDATYLAIAVGNGIPLATLDGALSRAAARRNLLWTPPKKKRDK